MMRRWLGNPLAFVGVLLVATLPQAQSDLAEQVRQAERAFAQTMADRDHDAFRSFLAEEAIFFGGQGAIRGRLAIAEAWKPFFDGPQAPFSWEPEIVEVLDSGTLALSSGPVKDAEGNLTGTFNTIWRLEPDSTWRVVFDKGCSAVPSSSTEPP
jgi:ketosteroid isomerase-like protein